MRKLLFSIILLFNSATAHAELWSGYTLGIGLGESHLAGDFKGDQSGTVHEFGFNLNQEDYLFRFLARTENDNQFKGTDLIFGYGNRYFKIGTGLMGKQGTIPTTDKTVTSINSLGIITVDKTRDTDVSVTTIPLLLSITPYHSDNFMINLEGYYGLYSNGSMTIPVRVGGSKGYIHSEPQRQGGANGFSASMTWGLRKLHKNIAVQLSYRYQEAIMNKQQTSFKGDAFGNLGNVNMPDLYLKQETFMLSFVYITDE